MAGMEKGGFRYVGAFSMDGCLGCWEERGGDGTHF
jgi:hypothetical protein